LNLPPIQQTDNCSDRVIVRRKGTGKPGFPLVETITLHNGEDVTKIDISASEFSKQTLSPELFDVPAGYREVKTQAELHGIPQMQQQPASYNAPGTQPSAPANSFTEAAAGYGGKNAVMAQAKQFATIAAGTPGFGAQFQNGGMMGGTAGGTTSAQVPIPQALGPKTPGKIRIGIAPAQAQLGQGNNAQADFGTPIRNAIILTMNGPAVEITGLDARVPMQVQAEAQQKQCDYILYTNVTVKRGGGGLGKLMKAAGPVTNMVPMVGMTKGIGGAIASQAAGTAMQTAAQAAQQSAMSQLAGFNGKIKSKDDVTIDYQLYPTGQPTVKLQNSLKGKAKSDGEDVMTPLLQQAANTILTEVTKK
jgi:hypothetical protein